MPTRPRPTPETAPPPRPLKFADELAERAAVRPMRKGERTQSLLRWATAVMIEERRSADIPIELIAERAGVSRAAFYQYFDSGPAVVGDVLLEFQRSLISRMDAVERGPDAYGSIVATHRLYVPYYAVNAALIEAIRQLHGAMPALYAEKDAVNEVWAQRIAGSAARARRVKVTPGLLLEVYALQSMVDDLLRQVYVLGNDNIVRLAPDQETLITVVSDLWYRALYA
jgi:AcrR family transcriptional regulator